MSKKKIILIVSLVLVLLVLGILFKLYVYPRIVVVAFYRPKEIKHSDLQKIELEDTYLGDSYKVEAKGISIELPFDTEEDDKLYVYDPGDLLAEIRKYGYRVWISRLKGEPLHEDSEVFENLKNLYLGASSFNEYNVKIHEYAFEEPSILLPPEELSIKYHTYSALDRFGTDESYYDSIVKDEYSFIVRLDDRYSKNGKLDVVNIDIYDNNDYAHIAYVHITKNYFTFETIAYIVDSIEVENY